MIAVKRRKGVEIMRHKAGMGRKSFYQTMGDVFAMREWRRRMPYIHNDESYGWLVAVRGAEILAFLSYGEKAGAVHLANEWGEPGLLEEMVGMVAEDAELPLKAVAGEELKKVYKAAGFRKSGMRGKYTIMEKKK